ncbi:acyl carrier protein [Pararhizobium qamdonense]|jgi:acyl carrier protein|uniref:acyl carrier protein n=1 Tax=Pararhizobium qamdonense TaxID=3031126 RepID=UPI0023E0E387|nr:acyl carrier protein [Pararhizobium qamdonense]
MTQPIKDSIKAFIIENFLFGDTAYDLQDDASLIENEVIDSTGVLELVAFIEDQFAFVMADADIVPANLDSVARITAFVARHAGENALNKKSA